MLLFLIFISCANHKQEDQICEHLAAIVATDEFTEYYKLCNKVGDTVVIYTEDEIHCNPVPLNCGKTVLLKKAYFPIRINEGPVNPPDEIAVTVSGAEYNFLDVRLNTFYSATIHNRKITVTGKGKI